LRKLIQISIIGVLGFSLVQGTKATGIQQKLNTRSVITDTTGNKDSLGLKKVTPNEPVKSFTNLFTSAVAGNDAKGARLNPQVVDFVKDYKAKNSRDLISMKEWGKPFFDMIDEILTQHGLPKELKYVAVIESNLQINCVSGAGAVGPWQLMPEESHYYGLKTSRGNDERMNFFKSTHTAARILTDLYARYGDWLLVIAGYNCGPGNINKAIRLSGGSKDFWKIQNYLPNETRNHVKKFIATHYIMEGDLGVTTVTKDEMKEMLVSNTANLSKEELDNSRVQTITGRYNSSVIAKYIIIDIKTFNHYNPGFENQIATNSSYELRLPNDKMDVFLVKKIEILNESIQLLLKSANNGAR
jgi:membrane-bound lytic murein transglycosylase D